MIVVAQGLAEYKIVPACAVITSCVAVAFGVTPETGPVPPWDASLLSKLGAGWPASPKS